MGNRVRYLTTVLLLAGAAAGAQVRGFDRSGPGERTGLADPAPDKSQEQEPAAEDAGSTSADPISGMIEGMDLRQRVAQLMLVTLSGSPAPNSRDIELLRQYRPAGVLLPSVLRPSDARDYAERLQSLSPEKGAPIPLLIGTNLYDLAKGRNRPNEFFLQLPSPLAIAAADDPQSTEQLAAILAKELTAMGFNLNLGPSLELAPTLADVRGTIQCFGSDPQFTAEAGGTILKALLDNGIVGVPMGFPGGGANRGAKGPAVLVTAGALLEERDLLPYRKAIELGAPAIHVSNTFVPTLESANVPASLSSAVMRDLLRQKLGFKGVVIAGPMDTNDVALVMDPTNAALVSLKAGADVLMWNESGARVMKTVEEIVRAVNAGELSPSIIDAALRRVLELKQKQGLESRALPKARDADKLEIDKGIKKTVLAIERKSLTLIQNRGNVLPLNKKASMPVGVTGEVGVDELHEALVPYLKYVVQQPILTAKHSGRIMDFEIQRLTKHPRGLKTAVCVFADSGETATKKELVRALQDAGMKVVVVLLGYPNSAQALSDADAILLGYCSPGAYAQTMAAVADVLVGQGPIGVRSTVRDMKLAAGEMATFNPLDVIHTPAGRLPVAVGEQFPAGLFVPYDPTFSLKKTAWDFGDGKKAKDLVAEHAYGTPGRYPVTLTVVDKKGNSTSRTFHASVE